MAVHGKFAIAVKTTLLFAPLLLAVWVMLPESRKESALALGANDWNIQARYRMVDYALEHFQRSPIIGVGVGFRETYDATNIVMSTLAETGVLGLFAFLLMHLAVFGKMITGARRVPYGTAVRSLTVLAFALVLARLLHGMVDHFWSRGSLTTAWMTVGMAMFALAEFRRKRILGV
jgi:hypothetical protein